MLGEFEDELDLQLPSSSDVDEDAQDLNIEKDLEGLKRAKKKVTKTRPKLTSDQ